MVQPKGADRKQKTDREKMEKRAPQEKEKYQPSYETTILTEVSVSLKKTPHESFMYDCISTAVKQNMCEKLRF